MCWSQCGRITEVGLYLVVSGFSLYQGKKTKKYKELDLQNYLVMRGFCYIRPLYNEVPLYKQMETGAVPECSVSSGKMLRCRTSPEKKMLIGEGETATQYFFFHEFKLQIKLPYGVGVSSYHDQAPSLSGQAKKKVLCQIMGGGGDAPSGTTPEWKW